MEKEKLKFSNVPSKKKKKDDDISLASFSRAFFFLSSSFFFLLSGIKSSSQLNSLFVKKKSRSFRIKTSARTCEDKTVLKSNLSFCTSRHNVYLWQIIINRGRVFTNFQAVRRREKVKAAATLTEQLYY